MYYNKKNFYICYKLFAYKDGNKINVIFMNRNISNFHRIPNMFSKI